MWPTLRPLSCSPWSSELSEASASPPPSPSVSSDRDRCSSSVVLDSTLALLSMAAETVAASLAGRRLRAGDDLHDLLGDLGLALAVGLHGQVVEHLVGVLRGVAHRGHARPVL